MYSSLKSKAKQLERETKQGVKLPIILEQLSDGRYIHRKTGKLYDDIETEHNVIIDDIEALEAEHDVIVIRWAE